MESDEEISEYERLRMKNLKKLEALMSSFDIDDDESFEQLNSTEKYVTKTITKKRKRGQDHTFRFTGQIPLEKRKSARLSNAPPEYTYTDLLDEDDVEDVEPVDEDDLNNLEKVVYRRRNFFISRKSNAADVVPVEEITEKYIANIAERGTVKVHSQTSGTSCHQCRQKTLDSKTYCRSGRCIGVRGQFCGVCLKNRYGEDAAKALLDPKWECPPCRSLCNCSICRARQGKRPTGILAPIAFRHGHKSVKDFLISLKGNGDYESDLHVDVKILTKKTKHVGMNDEHEFLLGFDKELNPQWVIRSLNFMQSDENNDCLGFTSDNEPCMVKVYK